MTGFYWAIEKTYAAVNGQQQMLHYPLFVHDGQSLIEGQRQFSDHVVGLLGGIGGRDVVKIGCGNGVQALYLAATNDPASYRGIDLYPPHIDHARAAAARTGSALRFDIDDAQRLATVAHAAADAALCVESAHHYPDKPAFLAQLRRILRPGGRFAIAELISSSGTTNLLDQMTDTFCWTPGQWQTAFTDAGLVLDAVDDVSERLAAGLGAINGAVPPGGGRKSWLARAAGRRLIDHYRGELAGDRRYLVFVGHRPTGNG
jgi:SAM-dependent methyltransferase